MGINIEMTGSGELGPLAPGWTVQEYATPVTIGETAGGTGNVSFTAAARDNSLFVVNNNITTTEETLGSISGVVKSVSQTGLSVNVNHNTALSIFDATQDIPALGLGGMYSALDLCSQLSGRDILVKPITISGVPTERDGHFYSMRGHSAGFNKLGDAVVPQIYDGSWESYDNGTGIYFPTYYRQQFGSLWADTFVSQYGDVWATHTFGDCFSTSASARTSRLAFKTKLESTESVNFGFEALPDDSNLQTGHNLSVSLSRVTGKLIVSGRYRNGSSIVFYNQESNLASLLDLTAEVAIFIEYTRPILAASGYTVVVKACNTSDYTNPITITQNFVSPIAFYNSSWTISGKARAIYREQGNNLAEWVAEYENPVTYMFTDGINLDGPVPAQPKTNMWEYLQNACTAFGQELSVVEGTIIVRPIGSEQLSIDDSTVPTITPNMTLTGRNVEVVYSNSVSIVNEELYSARDDSNRVISVKAGETITTTVPISGTPAVVNLPARGTSAVNGIGQYSIAYSTGAQVPQSLWAHYGGRLDVKISETADNAIDITLYGPSDGTGIFDRLPGDTGSITYPGPYKLAYVAAGSDYAALSITGSGIKITPKTLKIRTAADPLKVAQDIAKTITNPFISTKTQAYDRGSWAVQEASGPRVSLSASIPVSHVSSFGLIAGSLIKYRDSIYRVTDANVGNLVVSFNAVRHVTVDDFDTLWNGKNVESHDLTWLGYDASDQVIAPLRLIGDDESVLMFLDTDVNPYYDFTGEPEISVFQDTDATPYYQDGGNLDGEDEIRLDVDENPYDKDVE